MIEILLKYRFVRPTNPYPSAHQYEVESRKKQLDLYWKRCGIYEDNKMKLYSVIWEQSSKTTQSKLNTHLDYQQYKNDYDSLRLIEVIGEYVFKSGDQQYKYKAEDQAKKEFL
jgi:hypothetical protein